MEPLSKKSKEIKTLPSKSAAPFTASEELFLPKFYFQIAKEIEFYTDDEFMEYLESCLKNLQILFKISKQKCFDTFQKNKYEICQTLNELYADQKLEKKQKEINLENQIEENFICGICEESNKPSKDFYSLNCNHKFCLDCYKNYLVTSLDLQGFLFLNNTFCPMEECKTKVEIDFFENIFLDSATISAKLQHFLRLFMNNTLPSHIKHCPSPGCNYFYKIPESLGSQYIKVRCPNNHSFCHSCHLNWHLPFSCKENKFWFVKTDDKFRRDYLWVTEHCKKCPKCGWSIEKNEGCNHMTCRLCHHEFCWLCFQNYHAHNLAHCTRLSNENKQKKQKLTDTLKNFSKNDHLIKDLTTFFESKQRKDLLTLLSLKRKETNEKVEQFKKIQEIEEFLFFTGKIEFVFVPNQAEKIQLKGERETVFLKLTRLKSANPQEMDRMEKEFFKEPLKRYVKFIGRKLEELRKSQEEFSVFCNI